MNISSEGEYNALIVLDSLKQEEPQTGRRLYDDVIYPICKERQFYCEHIQIDSLDKLKEALSNIQSEAAVHNLKPILHLEMHGSFDKGGLIIQPTKQLMPWADLAPYLRAINHNTANNLVVMMALCYGLHVLEEAIEIQLTPFNLLVGPEKEINAYEVEYIFKAIYTDILADIDIATAVNKHKQYVRLFVSEEMFVRGFIHYVVSQCSAKAIQGRTKKISKKILKRGCARGISKKDLKLKLSDLLKPEQWVYDRFKNAYLMADHSSNAGRFKSTYEETMEIAAKVRDSEA